MKFYNPTFEDVRIRVDSKCYDFKSQSYLEVEDEQLFICEMIAERAFPKGIFIVNHGLKEGSRAFLGFCEKMKALQIEFMKEDGDFESVKRIALKSYMDKTLSVRIQLYEAKMDELKTNGKTVVEDFQYKTANRWKSEIVKFLNEDVSFVKETSFLKSEEPKKREIKSEEKTVN